MDFSCRARSRPNRAAQNAIWMRAQRPKRLIGFGIESGKLSRGRKLKVLIVVVGALLFVWSLAHLKRVKLTRHSKCSRGHLGHLGRNRTVCDFRAIWPPWLRNQQRGGRGLGAKLQPEEGVRLPLGCTISPHEKTKLSRQFCQAEASPRGRAQIRD